VEGRISDRGQADRDGIASCWEGILPSPQFYSPPAPGGKGPINPMIAPTINLTINPKTNPKMFYPLLFSPLNSPKNLNNPKIRILLIAP
jgi:hypothetical protein